jgi:GT2 family glycosyltransferase
MVVNSVSVIVSHYGRPDLVRNALLSIHGQTVKPTEVLLVDDSSPPEYREKLEQLADLATLITTPGNLGPSGARNLGAENAKGEWLAFLDDDDCWAPDKLERQIHYLEAHPQAQAVGGGLTLVTSEGLETYWGRKPTRQLTLSYALRYTASMSQALMIRRDVFLELGGFDLSLRYLEDLEFGIRLLASGRETHFLAESLFVYHQGGRQQLSRQWWKMFKAEMKIIRKHADLARKEFGPLGPIRLRARCCRKHGLWRGGIAGRSIWAWGCALEAAFGRQTN